MIARLELTHGEDAELRGHLRPILRNIFDSLPPGRERRDLLRLAVDAYRHQLHVRGALDELRLRLRERVNARFADELGIEPPGL